MSFGIDADNWVLNSSVSWLFPVYFDPEVKQLVNSLISPLPLLPTTAKKHLKEMHDFSWASFLLFQTCQPLAETCGFVKYS